MMGSDTAEPVLIDPASTVKIAMKESTLQSLEVAMKLVTEYRRQDLDQDGEILLWAVLFEAGRLQGIREERAKKKA